MNEVLEERIGEAVVDSLDDTQLEHLANLQETATDEEVQSWINDTVPNLTDMIQEEVDIILGEAAMHQAEFSSN